jgi:hypothetical protein
MAATIEAKYGTTAQAITITLASLGASATVGRASTAVDNSSNLFLDALVAGLIETGTVSGNKQVLIYAYGTADSGTPVYSGKNGANAISGTDAGFTRADPTDLRLIAAVPCPTSSVVMGFGPYSVAQAFGGVLPDHWGIVVFNDTGAALSATAGNNKAWYQGVQAQSV